MSNAPYDEASLFEAARQIRDPQARSEYLSRLCGGNAELIQRIETLLRADEGSEQLLDITVDHSQYESPEQEHAAGTQIGRYKLLQKLGEGGMGIVFMAEQLHPVKRRVAVKIIKPGMDSKAVIARFEAERQALAMMNHPNIASILDAGTSDAGYPYFVMELVKGIPITRYADQHLLSPRQRLELFVPVCRAVEHAHQKGIIHRDIKPSNVLVAEYDDHAVPKVIDFGVAKATQQSLTDKTLFTAFGQVVGTLDYMSPEQTKLNQLDTDTRSDIYSLGVLLYELLTGCTPFDRQRLRDAAFDELARIIQEEQPPRPSLRVGSSDTLPAIATRRRVEPRELTRQLSGDLDWIVMKTLEKDRTRRYPTVHGLIDDLQHHLNDEPVSAGPPSIIYRIRKLSVRHRGILTAIVLIAAITAFSIVALAIQVRRAEKNAADAIAATQVADVQRRRAESTTDRLNQRLYHYDMAQAAEAISVGDYATAREILARHNNRSSIPSQYADEWQVMNRLVNPSGVIHFHGHPIGDPISEQYFDAGLIQRLAKALEGPNLLNSRQLNWLSPDFKTMAVPETIGVTKTLAAKSGEAFRKQWFSLDRKLEALRPDRVELERIRQAELEDGDAEFPNPFPSATESRQTDAKELVGVPEPNQLVMNDRLPEVRVSPDGKRLVVVNDVPWQLTHGKKKPLRSWLRVFDIPSKVERWRVQCDGIDSFDDLGPCIAVSHHDPMRGGDRVVLYDPSEGRVAATLPCEPIRLGVRGHTKKFAISSDRQLICGALDSNHLWTAKLADDLQVSDRELIPQSFSFGQSFFYTSWEDNELREGRELLIISPSGHYCVSHSEGYLTLWDLRQRRHIGTIPAAFSSPIFLAFSENEKQLLAVNHHATIERSTAEFQRAGAHHVTAIDRENQWKAYGHWVNAGAGALQAMFRYGAISRQWLEAHTDDAELLACRSADGKMLLTTSKVYERLIVRDAETLEQLASYDHSGAAVTAAAFGPADRTLITMDLDGNLTCRVVGQSKPLWNRSLGDLRKATANKMFHLLADQRHLVARQQDGEIIMMDSEKGQVVWKRKEDRPAMLTADRGHLLLVAPSFHEVAVTNRFARPLTVMRLQDGKTFSLSDRHGTARETTDGMFSSRWRRDLVAAAVSPKGDLFAAAYEDGWAAIWSREEPEPRYEIRGLGRSLSAVAFSPDQQRVIFADDRVISFVDASSGQLAGRIKFGGIRLENLVVDHSLIRKGRPVAGIRHNAAGELILEYQTRFPIETLTRTLTTDSLNPDNVNPVVVHTGGLRVGLLFRADVPRSEQHGDQQFLD